MKLVSILILFLPVSLALAADDQPSAATLSWRDTQGELQSISRYKGKIVVLNFWATWCVPCQHEMPMLAEFQRKYSDQGLVVLGASVDEASTQPKIKPIAIKDNILFPLLVGVTTDEMQQLQLGEAIPATAFFDADGKLVGRILGELTRSDLQHRIEWMLGKHRGKEPPAFVNGFRKKAQPAYKPALFTH
jgi:thiol-disulfide isomerase/thioredoxin